MSAPTVLVVRITAAAGAEAELERELRGLVAPTRAEAGCLVYDLHRAAGEPGTFWFHEVWASDADLERHKGSAHVTGYRERMGERLAAVEVHRLEPLDRRGG